MSSQEAHTNIAPVFVPVFVDTQRSVRIDLPMITGDIRGSSNEHEHERGRQGERVSSSSSSLLPISGPTAATTTTILVSGLPAMMSVPDILRKLFFETGSETQEREENGSQHPHRPETPVVPNAAATTFANGALFPELRGLNRGLLHSVRVAFGAEPGTLSLLVTFFNGSTSSATTSVVESNVASGLGGTVSQAAVAFHQEWHGKGAFPLSKEIISVDFVDTELLVDALMNAQFLEKRRAVEQQKKDLAGEEKQKEEEEEEEEEREDEEDIPFVDEKYAGAKWWQFLEFAVAQQRRMDKILKRKQKQQQQQERTQIDDDEMVNPFVTPPTVQQPPRKGASNQSDSSSDDSTSIQNNPSKFPAIHGDDYGHCPICLEEVVISGFRYSHDDDHDEDNSSDASSCSSSSSSGSRSSRKSKNSTAASNTLIPTAPFIELPCKHLMHVSCFAAGATTTTLAGTISSSSSSGGAGTGTSAVAGAVSDTGSCPFCRFNCQAEAFGARCCTCGRKEGSLWVCLLCGDCFCAVVEENSNNTNNNNGDRKGDTIELASSSSSPLSAVSPCHRNAHFLNDPTHHLFLQSGGLTVFDCGLDEYVHRVLSQMGQRQNNSSNRNNLGGVMAALSSFNPGWRDHLSWAEDEAEVEANLMHYHQEVMETFYESLLSEQIQAQERHYLARAREQGLAAMFQDFFLQERVGRGRVAMQWRQELAGLARSFSLELRAKVKAVKQQRAAIKEEIELHKIGLAMSTASKEKLSKFLGPKVAQRVLDKLAAANSTPAAAASSSSPTTSESKKTSTGAKQQPQQHHHAPTCLDEVRGAVDSHPEVLALEKELAELYQKLSG